MIEIRINGESLDLSKKAKIRFLLNNENLNNEVFDFSYSFGVDIPETGNNHIILGFVNFVEVKKETRIYDCEVWHKGAFLLSGKFKLLGYNNNMIRANVEIGSKIHNISTTKSIRNLNYGPLINLGSTSNDVVAHANDIVNSDAIWPQVKYTFPTIYNQKFYDGKNVQYENVLNRYDGNLNTFIANTFGSGNVNVLVPQVFFNTVLAAIFEEMGYQIGGAYVESSLFRSMYIYGNKALDEQTGSVVALTLLYAAKTSDTAYAGTQAIRCADQNHWEDPDLYPDEADNLHLVVFDDDTSTPLTDDGNNYDNTTGEYTVPASGNFKLELNLKLKLNSLIVQEASSSRAICVYLYVYVDGDWIDTSINYYREVDYSVNDVELKYSANYPSSDPIYGAKLVPGAKVSIKLRAVFKDRSVGCSYGFGNIGCIRSFVPITVRSGSTWKFYIDDQSSVNIYKKTLNIGEHLPDWKCSDFINEFRKLFKLSFHFNEVNKTVEIKFLQDYFDITEEEDWTDKAAILFNAKIERTKSYGYKYELPADDDRTIGKEFDGEYFRNFDLATEKISFKMTPLAWCTTGNGTAGSSGYTGCPWIESIGNSAMFGIGTSNNLSSIRLAFFYGLKLTTDGKPYPMSTAFYFDVNGTRISDFSLQLNTELGVIDNLHKKFDDFKAATEEIEREVKLDIVDLNKFTFVSKKRIKNNLFLLKSVDISIAENIEPASCTLLKF